LPKNRGKKEKPRLKYFGLLTLKHPIGAKRFPIANIGFASTVGGFPSQKTAESRKRNIFIALKYAIYFGGLALFETLNFQRL